MARSRFFKSLVLASGNLLSSFISIISAMIAVRLLTKEDYGTYRQTMLVFLTASPILMMGLPECLYYFLPKYRDKSKSVLTENILLLAGMGSIVTIFLLFGGNHFLAEKFNNPGLISTLPIFAPYMIFMIIAGQGTVTACLMSNDKYMWVGGYLSFSRFFMLALVIIAIWISPKPEAAILGHVIGAGVMLILALTLMYKACPPSPIKPTKEGMIEQLKYAGPIGATRAFGIIRLQLDKILVAAFYPPALYAVYEAGAMELPLIAIITGSMTQVLLPDITRLYSENNKKEALSVWQRAASKSALVIFPITIFFMAMAPEVMRVLFSQYYDDSAKPFRLYTLLLPMRIANYGVMLLGAGKSKTLMTWHFTGLILNVVFSIILIKTAGYLGAAYGTLLTFYAFLIPYVLYMIGKLYDVDFLHVLPYKKLFKIGLSCLLVALVFIGKNTVVIELRKLFTGEDSGLYIDLGMIAIFLIAYISPILVIFDVMGFVKVKKLPGQLMGHLKKKKASSE